MDIIGAADEFWRLRLTRLDTDEGLDFEWHDDILYREPQSRPAEQVETWYVEAVSLSDSDDVVRIGSFDRRDEADGHLERASLDLREMTKNQFEESYLTPRDADAEFETAPE